MKRFLTLGQISTSLGWPCTNLNSTIPLAGVSVDSRTICAGELFFAIPGSRHDPHAFLKDVAAKGAVAAVVSDSYQGPNFSLPLFRTKNPLTALQELAKALLLQSKAKRIAITGSVGKTTTKSFVEALLKSRYRTAASQGNQNSQIGLPLTIINHFSGDEEMMILEMGMTEPGNLARLLQFAPPDLAILNSVELVHAAFFDSKESIAQAKAEIFSSPQTRLGIIHRDIPNFDKISSASPCEKVSFSTTNRKADCYLELMNDEEIRLKIYGQSISLSPFLLPAKYLIHNLLPAILAARFYQVDWEAVNEVIPHLRLPKMRFEQVQRNNVLFIKDCYNACELSTMKAMESLPEPENSGRKIAVLGSVKELGRFSESCHENIFEAAKKHFSHLLLLGDEFLPFAGSHHSSQPYCEWFPDRCSLSKRLSQILAPHDLVLLKGSNSHSLWKVLDDLNEIQSPEGRK